MKLAVTHSHNHGDHAAGGEQFRLKPFITLVGASVDEMSEFFQLDNWPHEIGVFVLGNQRHLAVIFIAEYERASLNFYDCLTGLLFTGDSFYSSRLYISNFIAYFQSISLLIDFIQSNHVGTAFSLSTQIEMTNTSQINYPTGTTYQPNERILPVSIQQL
ncbi:unnamed protein product [Adineta ricciae]|uniref:Uncharacterized protein n=1 Tax=Adineta ricciae TaxID=249248 RepID=A0A814DCA8_ADIRI|nr:unnamed protein product [Adineta ricciae]CAF0952413.1 unnamed protein product [Adineta ricciae]